MSSGSPSLYTGLTDPKNGGSLSPTCLKLKIGAVSGIKGILLLNSGTRFRAVSKDFQEYFEQLLYRLAFL